MVNIFFYLLVKGRLFEVKEFFLEDILKLIGFRKKEVMKYDEEAHKGKQLFQSVPECSLQLSLFLLCSLLNVILS